MPSSWEGASGSEGPPAKPPFGASSPWLERPTRSTPRSWRAARAQPTAATARADTEEMGRVRLLCGEVVTRRCGLTLKKNEDNGEGRICVTHLIVGQVSHCGPRHLRGGCCDTSTRGGMSVALSLEATAAAADTPRHAILKLSNGNPDNDKKHVLVFPRLGQPCTHHQRRRSSPPPASAYQPPLALATVRVTRCISNQ